MKILYAKCFGIGNAVMAVPAIKALASMGHTVDVLVGSTQDDVGALDVLLALKNHYHVVENIWVDRAHDSSFVPTYDLAILSIPFDGRWKNEVHFFARSVIDGRTRPDPSTTGLISWKKHEVEYQMDNLAALGYQKDVPSCRFMPSLTRKQRSFYFGVGYKKDSAGFWKKKHWGNENFSKLATMILSENATNEIYTTGDSADLQLSIKPIMSSLSPSLLKRFHFLPCNLRQSFDVVSSCDFYVGNDTGMMHVAAACDRNVVSVFFLENSIVKSRPWCESHRIIDGAGRTVYPEEVFNRIKEMS